MICGESIYQPIIDIDFRPCPSIMKMNQSQTWSVQTLSEYEPITDMECADHVLIGTNHRHGVFRPCPNRNQSQTWSVQTMSEYEPIIDMECSDHVRIGTNHRHGVFRLCPNMNQSQTWSVQTISECVNMNQSETWKVKIMYETFTALARTCYMSY